MRERRRQLDAQRGIVVAVPGGGQRFIQQPPSQQPVPVPVGYVAQPQSGYVNLPNNNQPPPPSSQQDPQYPGNAYVVPPPTYGQSQQPIQPSSAAEGEGEGQVSLQPNPGETYR